MKKDIEMSRSWIRTAIALVAVALLTLAMNSAVPSGAQSEGDKPKSKVAKGEKPKKAADEPRDEPKEKPQDEPKDSQDDDQPAKEDEHVAPIDDVAGFMHLKLEHAQHVLEGIAIEDYEMIAKHSQQINLLTKDAMWQVIHTEAYLQFSDDFARSARRVTEAARDRNLDGAALAYMQLTLGCVNCHKYTRDVRMARTPNDRGATRE